MNEKSQGWVKIQCPYEIGRYYSVAGVIWDMVNKIEIEKCIEDGNINLKTCILYLKNHETSQTMRLELSTFSAMNPIDVTEEIL